MGACHSWGGLVTEAGAGARRVTRACVRVGREGAAARIQDDDRAAAGAPNGEKWRTAKGAAASPPCLPSWFLLAIPVRSCGEWKHHCEANSHNPVEQSSIRKLL